MDGQIPEIPEIPAAASSVSRPNLSCERCKRRKIKCDRSSPACYSCFRLSRTCSYPLKAQKPGPKPGSAQRRKISRRQSPAAPSHVYQTSGDTGSPSNLEEASRFSTSPAPVVATEPERGASRGLTLSQLLHPSHDPILQSSSQAISQAIDSNQQTQSHDLVLGSICSAFSIPKVVYHRLLDAYFDNMTAFSLFHRPSFDKKVAAISSPIISRALLSSMFSLSRRFYDSLGASDSLASQCPTADHFRGLAEGLVDEALRGCSDEPPPLCLLQALVLVTFQQLIYGVRGRAWRSLGTCVRIAYELQLHLVDKNTLITNYHSATPSLDEEKRRLWWVIWEFDVFASTIRRLPTAIDWKQNETWLPIDDDAWYANAYTKSCHLDPDPAVAWKKLQAGDNQSGKAWFILVNALMRSAHVLSYPQAYSTESDVTVELDILANSLHCLCGALPPDLGYYGERLSFTPQSLQLDATKHSIQIMCNLARLMLYHRQVFDNTSRLLGSALNTSSIQQPAWDHYLAASSEIVTLVRNCSTRHVCLVNPFLASSIWLAAAAQIVYTSLSPAGTDFRVAQSSLDLLQCNLNAFNSTWGVSATFLQKLNDLQTNLKDLTQNETVELSSNHGTSAGASREISASEPPAIIQTDPATYQQPPYSNVASSGNGGAFLSNTWPVSAAENSSLEFALGSDLWGWGIDELMSYGTYE